jgi:hypothetical protein
MEKIYTFTEQCTIFKYMARPLLVPNPENTTIEELKQVSRVGSIETETRCTAKLLERLDQAILDVINIPKKTQKTASIGMLL